LWHKPKLNRVVKVNGRSALVLQCEFKSSRVVEVDVSAFDEANQLALAPTSSSCGGIPLQSHDAALGQFAMHLPRCHQQPHAILVYESSAGKLRTDENTMHKSC
jgi:hypothetical protein